MDQVQEATKNLIAAIEVCPEYERYQKARQKMFQYPILKKKTDEFRKRNYDLQNSDADIFEEADKLRQEYINILHYPAVWEYLTAEMDFCKVMQKMNRQILQSIEFDVDFEGHQKAYNA